MKKCNKKIIVYLLIALVAIELIMMAITPIVIENDKVYLDELNKNFNKIDYTRSNEKLTDLGDSGIVDMQKGLMDKKIDLTFKQNNHYVYFVYRFFNTFVVWFIISLVIFAVCNLFWDMEGYPDEDKDKEEHY